MFLFLSFLIVSFVAAAIAIPVLKDHDISARAKWRLLLIFLLGILPLGIFIYLLLGAPQLAVFAY